MQFVLKSNDNVTVVIGRAGVGKTTMMREVQAGIKAIGKELYGFAPSASASRKVMREEGFEQADTLAQLLYNPKLQKKMKDSVIWVDEAGLVGVKDFNRLSAIAEKQNARILLTGDPAQHSSVRRGDGLKLLIRDGGLSVARINQNQRQKGNARYRHAVELAAEGKADEALFQLDRQGGVIEIADEKLRLKRLVGDVAAYEKLGKSTLIVAPTKAEGRKVTHALRDYLKSKGMLGKKEREVLQLKPCHWTEENRRDPSHYRNSDTPLVLEFHQNARGGYRKGERWEIHANRENGLWMQRGEEAQAIPFEQAERFSLFEKHRLKLAKGDKIRLTRNVKAMDDCRLHNGSTYKVTGFDRKGNIKLHTGRKLDKAQGMISHGYTTTSVSAQGQTSSVVFISQSVLSHPASSRQQFYVSLSRGKERAFLYTDDKHELEKAVMRDDSRMTAREVAGLETRQREAGRRKQKQQQKQVTRNHESGLSL